MSTKKQKRSNLVKNWKMMAQSLFWIFINLHFIFSIGSNKKELGNFFGSQTKKCYKLCCVCDIHPFKNCVKTKEALFLLSLFSFLSETFLQQSCFFFVPSKNWNNANIDTGHCSALLWDCKSFINIFVEEERS